MPQASTVSENNKRIAKNTLMLYVKMAFNMGIGIFATRVLLETLGAEDYGLGNVIGGLVTMFAFLSETMRTACSRFFNFELGRQNLIRLKQTFNLTQLIYVGLVVVLFLLLETAGLWFLENKVVIPPDRVNAAFWFFQFSIFTFLLGTLSIPYSALIISHENIKAFAWIAIFESVARLGIIYLLSLSSYDKLAFYGALLMLVGVIHLGLNYLACRLNYKESRFAFFWEKRRFFELISFGGWSLWEGSSNFFTYILVSVLLNNYFGAAVNAARGIAQQVGGAISAFMINFVVATNPQIIKYYASGERKQAHLLTMRASRMGFFLLLFIALPAWLLMPWVLELWLDGVPAHTIWFTRLVLIQMLINVFPRPVATLIQASGKIALYQCLLGGIRWLIFPLAWVAFEFFSAPPEGAFWVTIGIACACLVVQLFFAKICADLPIGTFVRYSILPAVQATIGALIIPALFVVYVVPHPCWTQFFVVGVLCVSSSFFAIAYLGLTRDEREVFVRELFFRTEKLWRALRMR